MNPGESRVEQAAAGTTRTMVAVQHAASRMRAGTCLEALGARGRWGCAGGRCRGSGQVADEIRLDLVAHVIM